MESDVDIPLFKNEFKAFVKENLPAEIEGGYVVVEDVEENQSFHYVLYKLDDIERGIRMGQKYLIRTNEERVFPLQTVGYTDYTTNSLFEFLKLLIVKKGKILYITKWI